MIPHATNNLHLTIDATFYSIMKYSLIVLKNASKFQQESNRITSITS